MQNFNKRILIILCFMCAMLFIDSIALFKLQILDSDMYYVLSEKNRIRTYPIYPRRGEIYDRNGLKIAENVLSNRLIIANIRHANILKTVDELRSIIGLDISNDELKYRLKSMSPNSSLVIRENLSWDDYAKISLHASNMDNVILENVYTRNYVDPISTGHIVGYVGMNKNNEMQIEGKSGIERLYNEILFGVFGNRKIEVNAKMKFVRELERIDSISGENIKLTLDLNLQRFVYNCMKKYEAGACVVIDLDHAHILSAVSVPGIDTNVISRKISHDDWNKIISNKYLPLNNRIFRALYSPGSVFKIFLAYAALDLKKISETETVFCAGCTSLGNDKFHCWNRAGHGHVNLKKAIACSCDVYFHEVARRLGIDNIAKYSRMFSFGESSCDAIGPQSLGNVPDRSWKEKRYGQKWKEYETILVGTGQGYVLANIMQIATGVARLITMNKEFMPTLLFDRSDIKNNVNLNKEAAGIVKRAMYDVCNSAVGTARRSCHTDYRIAGKTGSTQVRRLRVGEHGISQNLLKWADRDHAIFAGFAPYKKPKYVVAVIIEHGGSGGGVAAPVAREIFDWLINEYDKKNKNTNI